MVNEDLPRLAAPRNVAASPAGLIAGSHLMMVRAQACGWFVLDGHEPGPEEVALQHDALRLSDELLRALGRCRDADILPLAQSYDDIYRIARRRMPDPTVMRPIHRRALAAWRHGRSGIEESAVFAMIAPKVGNLRFMADEEEMEVYSGMLSRWMDELRLHGRFRGVTTYENYMRLSLLQRHMIKGLCADPVAERRRWYEANRIDDPGSLGTLLLHAYRRFVGSMVPDVLTFEKGRDLDALLLAELAARPDLAPLDREACRLALHGVPHF